mmetsp:Transcript_49968/g.124252  ORF Transcript_49968/g.124252 Transcript_49968/m.124252 type:complete len:224 (-) Transcript_49968:592-1263(-)
MSGFQSKRTSEGVNRRLVACRTAVTIVCTRSRTSSATRRASFTQGGMAASAAALAAAKFCSSFSFAASRALASADFPRGVFSLVASLSLEPSRERALPANFGWLPATCCRPSLRFRGEASTSPSACSSCFFRLNLGIGAAEAAAGGGVSVGGSLEGSPSTPATELSSSSCGSSSDVDAIPLDFKVSFGGSSSNASSHKPRSTARPLESSRAPALPDTSITSSE